MAGTLTRRHKKRPTDPGYSLGRLCDAIDKARLQLRFFRQQRVDIVREYAGAHYSEDAAERDTPINLIAMYLNIVGRRLIPKSPRLMLSTFDRAHKPAVRILQDSVNAKIEQLNVANTLRRCVIDGLISVGIAKVAIASPMDAESANWTLKAGQPFIESIDFDDFVYDIHARDFTQCGYMGHRTRVPIDLVHSSGLYGDRAKYVMPTEDRFYNLQGDERIQQIGMGYYSNEEEYEDFVDLWEIYLRRRKLVITLTESDIGGVDSADDEDYLTRKALRVQKWVGPDCGPYHLIGFGPVPGSSMPKGPVQDIYDLHIAANNIMRKLIRQAKDTKRVTMVKSGKEEDGERVNSTPDGFAVACDDPSQIMQVLMNVPAQELVLLLENIISRASWLAGNFDLMGGLGPQAKTATQDKLNSAASSENLGSLQQDTLTFVQEVFRSFLWFEHHHPTNVHETEFTMADHGLPRVSIVRRSFPNNEKHIDGYMAKEGPEDPAEAARFRRSLVVRSHSFEAMRIKVDPHSLQAQTPQQRAQNMIDAVRNIYLPMAQLAQQQGVGLDLNAFFRKLGEYWDDPDLEEIFSCMQAPPEQGGGGQGSGVGPPGAPEGSKEPTEIIRRSQGADSQQAKEALVGNMMAKGAGLNGQAPMMGR